MNYQLLLLPERTQAFDAFPFDFVSQVADLQVRQLQAQCSELEAQASSLERELRASRLREETETRQSWEKEAVLRRQISSLEQDGVKREQILGDTRKRLEAALEQAR